MDIYDVFYNINNSSIRYCHFKSNAELKRAFLGEGDFDLLVHPDDYHFFVKKLLELGFKQRFSTFNNQYASSDNFLFYDTKNAMTQHFHVHTLLFFGEKFAKNHYIRETNNILNSSALDKNYPIRTISPGYEYQLLIIRIILKFKVFSISTLRLIIKNRKISKDMQKELDYLITETTEKCINFSDISAFSDSKTITNDFILRYTSGKMSLHYIFLLRIKLQRSLKMHERLPPLTSTLHKITRLIARLQTLRWLGNGGKTIAIVGADGSGKTTLSKNLNSWLSYKLNSDIIYLGLPKSFAYKLISGAASALTYLRLIRSGEMINNHLNLHVAKRRKDLVSKGIRNANSGKYTIFERYPLKEFWNMETPMDGPRIKGPRLLRERERNILTSIPDYADITIVLTSNLDNLTNRKSEHADAKKQQMLSLKKQAIDSIKEDKNKKLFIINADLPANDVQTEVQKILWEEF